MQFKDGTSNIFLNETFEDNWKSPILTVNVLLPSANPIEHKDMETMLVNKETYPVMW